MSRVSFLIDSDVIIDSMRADKVAANELERLLRNGRLGISIITRLELIIGCRDKQALQHTEQVLSGYDWLPLGEGISDIANGLVTKFHLSHGLKIPDAIICATAVYHAVPLLTKNQRDFRFIPGLKLLPYPGTPA